MKLPFIKKKKAPAESTAEASQPQRVPVIRCSICTGEKVAGFKDPVTGRIEEVMLIQSDHDLARFRSKYKIKGEIEKVY